MSALALCFAAVFGCGRDDTDMYAISLYKIFGMMILASIGSYIIARMQLNEILFEVWSGVSSMVLLAAFLLSSARRLRDIGKSVAFLAIFAVPVMGLCLFGYLLFAKSAAARSLSEPVG